MSTEHVDPRFTGIDGWPLEFAMATMWESQLSAISAVQNALPEITDATAAAADSIGDHGRLVYVGAGTSIRVAMQDGSELNPTFNWPLERIEFVIAGGDRALIESQEGAEDNVDEAIEQVDSLQLTPSDVVIGVAASGTTPFTVKALERAQIKNAVTIGIANNPDTALLNVVRHPICVETGSEVVAGSTRLKAGTSQKVVLNMISTGIMIRLGRVYNGLMVDMRIANEKLANRAVNMISHLVGCNQDMAENAIQAAEGDVKLGVLIASGNSTSISQAALKNADGNLRKAIDSISKL